MRVPNPHCHKLIPIPISTTETIPTSLGGSPIQIKDSQEFLRAYDAWMELINTALNLFVGVLTAVSTLNFTPMQGLS